MILHSTPKREYFMRYKNYNVPSDQFTITEKINKYTAYILGLLWADGNIYKNRITIEAKKSDMDMIQEIFNKTGKWNVYHRKIRKMSKSDMICLYTSNKDLYNFLLSCDYGPNNKTSAHKILNIIPAQLHKYWFRGLICGDGCFFVDTKTKRKSFTLAGPYNQNWNYFISILKKLDINKYSIKSQKTTKGSYSNIVIQNYDGIIKLGKYIYDEFELDKIGIERKYNKFILIKNMCKLDESGNITNNIKLSNDQIKEIKKLYYTENYSSRKLGNIFSVNKSTILDIINGKIHKNII